MFGKAFITVMADEDLDEIVAALGDVKHVATRTIVSFGEPTTILIFKAPAATARAQAHGAYWFVTDVFNSKAEAFAFIRKKEQYTRFLSLRDADFKRADNHEDEDDEDEDDDEDDEDEDDDEDEGKPTPEENRMRRYDEIERKAWPRLSAKKHADNDEHEFGVEAEEGEASKLCTHYHVWEYASGGSPRRTIAIFDERLSAERYADEHVAAFEDPYVARGDARSGYSITSTVSDGKADLGAIRIEACESDGCTPDV